MTDADDTRLGGWLDLLRAIDETGYADVRVDDLPEWVRSSSRRWAARLFRPGAGPYAPALDVRHRVHRARPETIDALRHDFVVDPSLQMSVVESGSVVVTRIHGPTFEGLPEPSLRRAVDQAFAAAIRTWGTYADAHGVQHAYHWVFEFRGLAASETFSTRPDLEPPRMQAWTDRVDGAIDGPDLCVLHYKIEPSSGGLRPFVDDRRWFEP
jgi:hypothetical protein